MKADFKRTVIARGGWRREYHARGRKSNISSFESTG
jgi:hypothetical protein